MARIAMLEGYHRKPRKRRHLKGHRKHRRSHLKGHARRKRRRHMGGSTAHRKLFGKVARICLVGKKSRGHKSKCMKIGLTKGLKAAQAFARR
jgi:hypothetical protein